MALEGTLRDFSVADIFQLIGLQRKSGVLTLKREGEVVTVTFHQGSVVAADTLHRPLEDRLGTVLVKSGKLTDARLQEALALQRKTLQRLGFILLEKRFIEPGDLREALTTQITQIVYRLFRWSDGDYHFSQESEIDFDRENFEPIAAETILMEGARMMDEWPFLERHIPSFDMVFHPVGEKATAGAASVYEEDIDFGIIPDEDQPEGGGTRLSREEMGVLRLVDGRHSVQEIIDSTNLGDFETCRVLCQLLDRQLIRKPLPGPLDVGEPAPPRLAAKMPWAFLGTLLLLLVAGTSALLTVGQAASLVIDLPGLPPHPSHPPETVVRALGLDDLRLAVSRTRLERIDRAVHAGCFVKISRSPDLLAPGREDQLLPAPREGTEGRGLEVLAETDAAAAAGYGAALLSPADLLDSWGRPFRYDRGLGGAGSVLFYELVGRGASGLWDSRLTLHRELWDLRALSGPRPDDP